MAKLKPRKILTAALGVATVSYVVGCGRTLPNDDRTTGSVLDAGRTGDVDVTNSTATGVNPGFTISGNLMPPPPVSTTTTTTTTSVPVTPIDSGIISGNLLPPPDPTTYPGDTTVNIESGTTSGTVSTDGATTDWIIFTTSSPPDTVSAEVDASVTDTGENTTIVLPPDAGVQAAVDAGLIISGNLLPPPLPDAGGSEE